MGSQQILGLKILSLPSIRRSSTFLQYFVRNVRFDGKWRIKIIRKNVIIGTVLHEDLRRVSSLAKCQLFCVDAALEQTCKLKLLYENRMARGKVRCVFFA